MTDRNMIAEVLATIANDGQHYTQQIRPVILNLARKMVKGNYDNTLALKLWGYVADEGVKRYSVAQMGRKSPTLTIMSKADRQSLAQELQHYYEDMLESEAAEMKAKKGA